jgi:hypothetical protein
VLILIPATCLQAQVPGLEPREQTTRQIGPQQKQNFIIRLEARQFCRITVTQQPGIDLILNLYEASRRKLARVGGYRGYVEMVGSFPIRAALDEVSLSFVSSRRGVYELEIDSQDTQISGSYKIQIVDSHRASAEDSACRSRTHVQAW